MPLLIVLALALLAHSSSVSASVKPTVQACHEDGDSYPWVLKDRPGLNLIMLQMVEAQIGSKIELIALPWRRCMERVQTGRLDAAFKISYSAARAAEVGNYPMEGGKPDASKRMLTESYSLYRLKGGQVEWDGKAIKVNGPVGAQSGYSVVDLLRSMGAAVDDGSRDADTNLQKLRLGRFQALALQTEEGDASVAIDPELKGKVERMSPVLIEKPYYFIFSKAFTAKHPDHVKDVWEAIERVRESPEYASAVKKFRTIRAP